MIVLHVIMVLSKMNKVEPIARYIAPKLAISTIVSTVQLDCVDLLFPVQFLS